MASRTLCGALGAFLPFLSEGIYSCASFRLIKHNATSGHSTSYMLSYMHPVYKAGQSDSGKWTFVVKTLAHADC